MPVAVADGNVDLDADGVDADGVDADGVDADGVDADACLPLRLSATV